MQQAFRMKDGQACEEKTQKEFRHVQMLPGIKWAVGLSSVARFSSRLSECHRLQRYNAQVEAMKIS